MDNSQSFSINSADYAKHRPQYPPALFAYLNKITQHHHLAWDCATGNGQAAVSAAKYFAQIEATDISAEQIEHRLSNPQINYSICAAEKPPFKDNIFDLIMVAQAVHWFDKPAFFAEAERLLKPNGVLAVWGYGGLSINAEIDSLINEYLNQPIDRFWAEGNREVMAGYRELVLPFNHIPNPPTFEMQIAWNLPQLLAYFSTWSAVKRYTAELGQNPLELISAKLKPVWQNPEYIKTVSMPLFIKVSRKPAG